jgi:hypothetical protein
VARNQRVQLRIPNLRSQIRTTPIRRILIHSSVFPSVLSVSSVPSVICLSDRTHEEHGIPSWAQKVSRGRGQSAARGSQLWGGVRRGGRTVERLGLESGLKKVGGGAFFVETPTKKAPPAIDRFGAFVAPAGVLAVFDSSPTWVDAGILASSTSKSSQNLEFLINKLSTLTVEELILFRPRIRQSSRLPHPTGPGLAWRPIVRW